MNKFIILQDGKMLGYLNDESSVKRAISNMADKLSQELRNVSSTRVYMENIENGVRIYVQSLGTYIDGSVILKHTIEWISLRELEN